MAAKNMKKYFALSFTCLVIGTILGTTLRTHFQRQKNESLCVSQHEFATNSLEEFLQEEMQSSDYVIKIVKTNFITELLKSPNVLGVDLYDDIKGSALCSTDFDVSLKNTKTDKDITQKIKARYQLIIPEYPHNNIYIKISNPDLEQASKKIKEYISEQAHKDALNALQQMLKNSETKKTEQIKRTRNIVPPPVTTKPLPQSNHPQTPDTSDISKVIQQNDEYVDAKIIVDEFEQNVVAFQNKYTNKNLKISGKIYDINSSMGKTYVMISDGIGGVQCFAKDTEQLIPLKKGDKIKVQGLFKAEQYLNINLILDDCIIVQ